MSDIPFSYFCFGCVELANHARLSKYVEWAAGQGAWQGQRCCVEMPNECWCPADGDPSDFVDPVTDGACWVDALIPESADYLGMYVTKVTGLNDSTFKRAATENIGRGVTLGRGQVGSRVFAVEALLIATSCCGMDYGEAFVRRTLELGGCGAGSCLSGCGDLGTCGLTCMTARTCCPDFEGEDTGLRQWVNAGLIDGLAEVDEDSTLCRCCMRAVTFTIQTETPEGYSITPVVCLDKDADLENVATRCFDWVNGCATGDEAVGDCTDDPLCPPGACVLPSPPQRVNYCFCEPLGVSIDCCCLEDLPAHRDETYRIIIDAGKNPNDAVFSQRGLRNARVKFYTADPKLPCPSDDEASAGMWGNSQLCASLEIPYLKPGSRVVIDGRTDRITVECDNKCFPGAGNVFGVGGSDPFPLLASCHGIIICVEWSLQNTQFVDDLNLGAVRSHARIERYHVYA